MKDTTPQMNRLDTVTKNVQEHLSFDTLEGYPGETGDKGLGVHSPHIHLRM